MAPFRRFAALLALAATSKAIRTIEPGSTADDDLAWQDNPRAWHQQTARIKDHRFLDFPTMRDFARQQKAAGVSVLMLVQIHRTDQCPGVWYNGLQLCSHINGDNPSADGTLEQW